MTLHGRVAVALLVMLVLAAIVGQYVWTIDPLAQDPLVRLKHPSLAHPFGTDNFGRDILARLVLGARWSLLGAAVVCCGTSLLGFVIGALAASGPRLADNVIGRSIEAMLARPGLVM